VLPIRLALVVAGEEAGLVAVLAQLAQLRRDLDLLEFEVVSMVRAHGATWERIGGELGISRQATATRYGKVRRRRT
jgi:hypothetical protein